MFGYGFGMGFGIFEVLFFLVFFIILGVFVVTFVKGIGEWNKNNHSPRLTVPVTVVAKRTNVSHSRHHNSDNMAMSHTSTSTSYYVTFQVESGDRMELHMSGAQFGLIVEGDKGLLTFQGTRFLDFQRQY